MFLSNLTVSSYHNFKIGEAIAIAYLKVSRTLWIGTKQTLISLNEKDNTTFQIGVKCLSADQNQQRLFVVSTKNEVCSMSASAVCSRIVTLKDDIKHIFAYEEKKQLFVAPDYNIVVLNYSGERVRTLEIRRTVDCIAIDSVSDLLYFSVIHKIYLYQDGHSRLYLKPKSMYLSFLVYNKTLYLGGYFRRAIYVYFNGTHGNKRVVQFSTKQQPRINGLLMCMVT